MAYPQAPIEMDMYIWNFQLGFTPS
jgi:hypothetical protein